MVHAVPRVVEVLERELRRSDDLAILNGQNLQDPFAMATNPADDMIRGHRFRYVAGDAVSDGGDLKAVLAKNSQRGVDLGR